MGIEETLRRSELFLGLSEAEMSKIVSLPSYREETFQPDDVVFRRGSEAQYLFILKEGQVDLIVDVPSRFNLPATQVVVDKITKGGCFGWSAVVRPHFYVGSAICVTSCIVTSISGAELISLCDNDYRLGYRVYQTLSQIIGARLRDVEQALATGQRWPFLRR